MPFASSRGYGSSPAHDVAQMLNRRYAKTGQWAKLYFVSDLDPSGLDLQRSWEEALANFGVHVFDYFVRIGLTRDQVRRQWLMCAATRSNASASRWVTRGCPSRPHSR